MSRRSVTNLTVQVRVRVPVGCTVPEVLEYIRAAIAFWKTSGEPGKPISSLDENSLVVKLEKKETVYL